MGNIKILELFAGIGACSSALKRLGFDIDIVDAIEIDKYAMASFNAIHNTNFEPQDITKWDKELKDIDLITHGSPCQDFSVAGKQAGGDLGSGTRSSLMYETIRIVGKVRPKYVLWENVKNLLSSKHRHNFNAYIETMNILGYNSYYQVLNAKDYGIPQNRERVYTVSIRKDIHKKDFVFPEKEELQLRLKDMLEDEVNEKYYLSKDKVSKIQVNNSENKKDLLMRMGGMYGQTTRWGLYNERGISPTLVAAMGEGGGYVPMVNRIGGIFDIKKSKHQAGNIYDKEDINPTLDIMQGGWRQPSVLEEPFIVASRGRNPENPSSRIAGEYTEQRLEPNKKGTTNCISTVQKDNWVVEKNYRIRKLTPKECWRLMGFTDDDFEKAAKVPTSNTQLYKQAGNSIVVNVLEKIFKNLLEE